ncbi:primosomal protein N' [candidate division WOR-1 bacterium RIFOXYA12_FULL_43_27]|uniref:Replication restart protein PriA n=1 Tax=candidate division WOR-1 bacterium RIFOXYC2_FULL_46_14 TaxID=1802587 RepID=A0A1F4U4U6_UNCSA|nr:MAG: primosomal protein N' [candidate division WOR-1 bacterium RIFOXYA12_FULL_43_27]OGC20749.1 MAG: primosomal protein N' [candidate division WOR-1 bacterium RIFOXYB2_FULL_46_45]OGC31514.1 MAG: primosomal protein N' [candidate division WOR-1 bacterium RIFOXYA2_FULL_46_56]OGC39921.1 MAG: primosomal protein N' [candidate division WOR-1 bacterium RIFOXYC2_FULL_46_14]
MYAHVILSAASAQIDKIFHYGIPENIKDQVKIGSQVSIPFGKGERIGYVVGFSEKPEGGFQIKDIIAVISPRPLFNEKQLALAKWIADYYKSFQITALRLIMPPSTKQKEVRSSVRVTKPVSRPEVRSSAEQRTSNIDTGIVTDKRLTDEQNEALKKITATTNGIVLLYGITGSGKTEVYLQSIAECVKNGRQAIVLVPEIALTPQIVQRFKERFGDQLAILHSDKTMKQRDNEWWRVYNKEAPVVLGTRSALFAPLDNIGLIIMDEEYEYSYKQDKSPRYHTRTAAKKLAELHNAVLVLGSATPSIETFYKAQTKEYTLAKLSKRIDNRPLPPVEIVDLREEKGLLSKKLKEEIEKTLDRNEKIILFLNRRGFFRVSFCEKCGESIKCPNCSVPLILHEENFTLECSYCEHSISANIPCPNCQNINLSRYGLGTQRIEADITKLFKKAKVLRVDKDAVKKRGSHDDIFEKFSSGEANILIGTQMVVKGLDLAEVTLVGVINADVSLNIPDFRAAEHTFQHLTQVAGRAGRHHLPGKVIIQTFNPEHYAIKFAKEHDYDGFYEHEIKFREELFYPPFSELINIEINGEDEKSVDETVRMAKKLLEKYEGKGKTQVLGPAKAPLEKLRGNYRRQILLKGEKISNLLPVIDELGQKVILLKNSRMIVDVEPVSFL